MITTRTMYKNERNRDTPMDKQRINTDTLLEIIQTRMKSNDNNPTLGSLLFDLYIALSQLNRASEMNKDKEPSMSELRDIQGCKYKRY